MTYLNPTDNCDGIERLLKDAGGSQQSDALSKWKRNPNDKTLRAMIWRFYGVCGVSGRGRVYDMARQFLPRPLTDREDYGFVFEVMMYCLVRSRPPAEVMEEVARIIDLEQALNGESYWLHNAIACYKLNIDKNDTAAFLHFSLAAAELKGASETYHISSGCETIRPLDYDLADFAPRLPQVAMPSLDSLTGNQFRCVHLISADSVYFRKYVNRLLESVANFRSNDDGFHVHIIDPDEECRYSVRSLMETFPWFSSSESRMPIPENGQRRSKMAYYASVRYMVAPVVMEQLNCSVIVTDADFIVDKSYDGVWTALQSTAAIFTTTPGMQENFYPWLRCAANFSAFAASEDGRKIAQHLGDYISRTFCMDDVSRNWLVDQNATWHAYEKFSGSIARGRASILGINNK